MKKTALLLLCAGIMLKSKTYSQTLPTPDHVVIVVMENHGYSQIIGASQAPYINSLATGSNAALFTQSYALTHPSQPNYILFFSGANQGVSTDNISGNTPFTTCNLGASLLANKYSFAGYSEDLPAVGSLTTSSGNYARKHNPWSNWQGASSNAVPSACNQPFTAFPSDYNLLPDVSFVIPNQNNDMHNPTSGTTAIVNGDNWLKNHLDNYIQWAKTHNSLLILTFDEDDNGANNHITTLFVGEMVKKGSYAEKIDHYTVLRTLEDIYKLPHCGGSATSTPVSDCWIPPSVSVSAPAAAFTASATSVCNSTSVTFTDNSANTPTSWSWTFAGGIPATSTLQNPVVTYAVPGTYGVTLNAINAGGNNTMTKTNYITVRSTPAAPTITSSGMVLTSSSYSGNQWYADGKIIQGDTGQTFTATRNGLYTVVVTSNGCSSIASAPVTIISTGTDDSVIPDAEAGLNAYPNPNSGSFTVSFSLSGQSTYTIELRDVLGQKIFTDILNDFNGTYSKNFNVSVPGMYTVTLMNDRTRLVKKVVVE